jgi:acrylyl-CoA reductase (NADPH)
MSQRIRAIVARDHDGKTRGTLEEIETNQLPDEEVLVDVAYSTVNYKDGLAVSGKGRICRSLPMVCGIDLAGTVRESRSPKWQPGDRVLVNGFGLSEKHWGGYAQQARLKPEWLVRVPAAFSHQQAMALGTAGYTAMLCVLALQDHGLKPSDGPVLVTGAAGGVGSVSVMLLAALGFEVCASTGRVDATGEFLRSLGATRLLAREELARDAKPLEAETWAGVVDSVGDKVLGTALAQTRYEGIVAACGLAGGATLPTSVMPFILRGVTLRGIDSVMAALPRRQRAWDALAKLVDPVKLAAASSVEPLSAVPRLANEIIAGQVRGRVVIDVNA